MQVSSETLFDFESIHKNSEETHSQFFERLLQHTKQHLAPADTKLKTLLTLSRTVNLTRTFFQRLSRPNVSGWNFLTFPIDTLKKDFRKKIWNFFRGYPPFGPPKPVTDQKWPPMTPYDPQILMHNPFLHKKWGCFQKTRAPYFEKWPSFTITSAIFEILLNFFQGVPPFWPPKAGRRPKMTTHDSLWPPNFNAKSFSTQKMGMFPKN